MRKGGEGNSLSLNELNTLAKNSLMKLISLTLLLNSQSSAELVEFPAEPDQN